MNEIKPWRGAGIYRNANFILIETRSGRAAGVTDPDGAAHFLDVNADDETLGHSLIDALSKSRFFLLKKNQSTHYSLTSDWWRKIIKVD